jgi:hypothetical protein
MKVVLIVIGSLGGLYALAAIVQFVRELLTANGGTAIGGATVAASIAPVCLGLIICLSCFRAAFGKQPGE